MKRKLWLKSRRGLSTETMLKVLETERRRIRYYGFPDHKWWFRIDVSRKPIPVKRERSQEKQTS